MDDWIHRGCFDILTDSGSNRRAGSVRMNDALTTVAMAQAQVEIQTWLNFEGYGNKTMVERADGLCTRICEL